MCKLCELKEATANAVGLEKVEEHLAFIGKDYLSEIAQLDQSEDQIIADLSKEEDRLIELAKIEIKAQIEKQFLKKLTELGAYKREVFNEALRAVGVDDSQLEGKEVTVNKETGKVTAISWAPKVSEGVH